MGARDLESPERITPNLFDIPVVFLGFVPICVLLVTMLYRNWVLSEDHCKEDPFNFLWDGTLAGIDQDLTN